jgi:ribosomal protein L29
VTDIDIEGLSIEELEQLRDAINQRLLQLRYSNRHTLPELLRMLEEVKALLNDQGKQWRSLERWQWMDGQIRFWLNPTDQVQYQSGWFTIDELIQWSQNNGPVLISEEPEEDEDEPWTEVDGVRIRWLADGTMQREG